MNSAQKMGSEGCGTVGCSGCTTTPPYHGTKCPVSKNREAAWRELFEKAEARGLILARWLLGLTPSDHNSVEELYTTSKAIVDDYGSRGKS